MGLKRWVYASVNRRQVEQLKKQLASQGIQLSELAVRILQGRGYDASAIAALLQPSQQFTDPYRLKDMDKAVERIREAIDNEERIAVYGDYDCDGITATALLCGYLESSGADVVPYIPTREDGYGLNRAAIRYLSDIGITLIVTVDNGISAAEEIAYAATLGVDVVVTDHHQPPENLPQAVAVVDPHRRDCTSGCTNLAGVGVAFKLACALEEDTGEELLEYYGVLAAIGTVGDVVPLVGENRTMVQLGLTQIAQAPSPGIAALLEVAGLSGKRIGSESIAFGIVPRINAVGRMGDASAALQLLMTDDPDLAQELATQIDSANRQRREIEAKIVTDISLQFQRDPRAMMQRAVVVQGKGWHHGVIGIVSSRVVERFGKPCLLVAQDEDGISRGSARSVEGFSMIEAVTACQEYLTRFGGHPMAAGFSLKPAAFEDFRSAFLQYAQQVYQEMPVYTVHVDAVLDPEDLKVETIKSLSMLEPFGAGNEAPVFAIRGAKIDTITPLGEGKHLRLRLVQNGVGYQVLYFGMTPKQFAYRCGDTVDALVSVDVSVYNGEERLSVKIKDLRLSAIWEDGLVSGQLLYERLMRGEKLTQEQARQSLPSREETGTLYRYLREQKRCNDTDEILYGRMCQRLKPHSSYNFCKMRVALDALGQLKLIQRQEGDIVVVPSPQKVDLQSARIFKKIQSMITNTISPDEMERGGCV